MNSDGTRKATEPNRGEALGIALAPSTGMPGLRGRRANVHCDLGVGTMRKLMHGLWRWRWREAKQIDIIGTTTAERWSAEGQMPSFFC